MNNKIKIAGHLFAVFCASNAFSGTVASIQDSSSSSYIPFVSIEGSLTNSAGKEFNFSRSKLNSLTATDTTSGYANNKENPWGGRLAGGVILPYSDTLNIGIESGWNYFDSCKNSYVGTLNTRTTGVDLLAGLDFKHNQYTLFARAGTLFQNVNATILASKEFRIASQDNTFKLSSKNTQLTVLPEIKVGGVYNINARWGISLAYMHAFGSNPKFNETLDATSTGLMWDISMDARNPTLDSGLLGIHYNFTR